MSLNTWRDILKTLENIDDSRLDDIAAISIDDDIYPIELLEVEIDEIGDDRLIAYRVADL